MTKFLHHLIMMATVRVMSPADTPTADAKAMTLRRPVTKVVRKNTSTRRREEKG